MARIALGGTFVLVGCGDDGLEHGVDAPTSNEFVTAQHTALPQANAHAGVVFDHPKLVTITYSNYAAKTQVEGWGDAVVTSNWWALEGPEWGIGSMTHDAKVTLGLAPTTIIQDVDIENTIKGLVAGTIVPTVGTFPVPTATDNQYVYMIYIPPTTPIGATLQDIYGYHAMLTNTAGTRYAYAVILDDGTGADITNTTAAHELIETATDPLDPPHDGFYVDPPLPDPWYLALGEVADLCQFEKIEQEGAFYYERAWSNAAAAADKNPCVPSHDEPWNTVTADPVEMPTIAAGESVTFTLTGWSTAEMEDWQLDASTPADYSDLLDVNPQLSETTINNGTTVELTLTAPATAHSGELGGVYVLSGDYYRPWVVGFVVQ